MLDAKTYVFEEGLKDGRRVTLRAARPEDGPRIRRAFMSLDRETIHSRFFGVKKEVSDQELRNITDQDFDRNVSLLVTIPSGDDEIVIGGASYFSTDSAPPERSAEVAFTIVKEFQGQGVAGMLMRRLVGIARERGFTRLEADVLDYNKGMLGVFKASGLPMTTRHDGNVVHVALSLRREGA
jgi:RimJ/RimL family protein N-acetyltransferase